MRYLLALAALAAAGVLARVLTTPPDYGRVPRLAAVIDGGKMEDYLESAAEKATLLDWVAGGAPESGWREVSVVLERHCTICHYTDDGAFEILPLDAFETAAHAATVAPVLREKITGGSMGEYLENRDHQEALVAWIDAGALEATWPEAERIFGEHCTHCHNPDGVRGIPRLDRYATVARLATLPEPAPRRVWAPAIALIASSIGLGIYGRARTSPES